MTLANETPYQGKTNIWLTPPRILAPLGYFDLDPCAAPEPRPWPTARVHYTEAEGDGLSRPWEGFVWCNPPYGPHMAAWLNRLAVHDGGGIALTFARTETQAFFESVWSVATILLFIKGRLRFHRPDGSAGESAAAPSVLIGYGKEARRRLEAAGHLGCLVEVVR